MLQPLHRVLVMQVDRPCCSETGIIVRNAVQQVLLGQDHVAHEPPGFSFSPDIGYPRQAAIGVIILVNAAVLQERPVAKNSPQGVVAYFLHLCNLVREHAGLPLPVAPGELPACLLVKLDRPGCIREKRRLAQLV